MTRSARFTRIVAASELPIVLAMAPALLFPTPERLMVLAAMPIIWFCTWSADGRVIPRTPLNVSLWLMLTMVGVSLHATFDVRFSLGKVSGVVLGVLLLWAIARWFTTSARLKVATAAFLMTGAGLAVVGLLGADMSRSKFSALAAVVARLPRAIRGVPGAEEGFNSNPVAGCLVLFIPLQVALLAPEARRWLLPPSTTRWADRWLVVVQAILLLLTAGTVVLMQSRGAWEGLAVATGAFLIWHSRLVRRLSAAVAGAMAVVVVALGPQSLLSMVISRSDPRMANDVSVRMALWSSGLAGIQDFPWTGMGMNAFRRVMMARYPVPEITAHYIEVAHAHNNLLQTALDLGLPGLVAYVAMWLVAAVLLVMVYRRSGERVNRVLAGGLGAGLIAHFMFGMTDAIPLGAKVGVLFWLTLAMVVGLHRVAGGRSLNTQRARAGSVPVNDWPGTAPVPPPRKSC